MATTDTIASGARPLGRGWWVAPRDRPRRHRGLRGWVSASLAVLALVVLSARSWHGSTGGGGGGPQLGSFSYTANGWQTPELIDAIRRVARGEAVFSPRLAGFVLDAFAQAGPAAPEVDPELAQLTPREQEVLEHIARGYLYKEIAQLLGVSTRTVESHVSAVLRKLSLPNRHQLARWAAQHHLID